MTGLVGNFTGFAPLGTVLVALIGIGVAEHSGLIGAALRRLVLAAPRALLTPILVFAGVMSNMASEIGYVLLVPLGGLIFIAAGRHPILGMVAAIAGVSGGYSANLLIGTIDPLLSGLSEEAARIVDPDYRVTPLANWHFMIVSTPILTLLGFAPELTQAAYRVGDSVTNIISPMMSHFALIIAFFRRYEPQAGIDTLVAVMLPYSVVFLVGWSALFAPWLVLGLPTGPGAAISY
jgi:aminobenzoyl-glutamate transport protein